MCPAKAAAAGKVVPDRGQHAGLICFLRLSKGLLKNLFGLRIAALMTQAGPDTAYAPQGPLVVWPENAALRDQNVSYGETDAEPGGRHAHRGCGCSWCCRACSRDANTIGCFSTAATRRRIAKALGEPANFLTQRMARA